MTTFDDTGIFDQVEEAPGEAPHRARVVGALVVAALLVAAGVAWLLFARATGGPDPAAMSVGLLDREAQPTDELAAEVVEATGLDPSTSRFAVRTTEGQHYAAKRWSGDLCLVVVPDGDAARAVCTPPSATATVTLTGADSSRVRLVADEAAAPAPQDGEAWHAAGTNIWVLDAPATG